MEYLEDYLSEEMIDELTAKIANVIDDDAYILSTLSAFDNDEQASELLKFLQEHPNATQSDIDLCTVRIYNLHHQITFHN